MSGNDDATTGALLANVTPERVREAFDGVEPATTAELAAELNVEASRVREACLTLVERDVLDCKDLRTDHGPLRVWYRTLNAHDEDVEARAERAIAALAVPGTSEMMRDWRRDAVRAAFEHLAEEGSAIEAAFTRTVYPSHVAGFDEPENWWAMVEPRLRGLPGVSPPGSGESGYWTAEFSR